MKLKLIIRSLVVAVASSMMLVGCANDYQTIANDPLKTRIYTLDNGLKVYMTINKEEPRVQTYIAVRVGSKNDPAETTGLAHYFEHLMFKGTENYGTSDYAAEKVLLDQIEETFEVYRKTEDEAERNALYAKIDSLSYEASKYSIANEYDKLMSAIGAEGTNAYTANDMTVYQEDIPSNQVENWAKIQADRFKCNVIRGFHTELETVYEEKNMSLTKDNRKVLESLMAGLYPHHPYGTQTTLGSQEHLKNPSITNIKNYYRTYYVPNNMAICLSGDIDPEKTMEVIEEYFGDMEPNENLPEFTFEPEPEFTEPVIKEVWGLDAENVALAWRTDAPTTADYYMVPLVASLLHNGQAGLIDMNINQQQKTLFSYAMQTHFEDYGFIGVAGMPKQGQSLDEVAELLLAEVDKLRNGEFSEDAIAACVANLKAARMNEFDNNSDRAHFYVSSYTMNVPLEFAFAQLDNMAKVTKQDVIDFVNNKMRRDNFVAVYKRCGEDKNIVRMPKPEITPILTNRDKQSAFLQEILESEVKPIEPQFLDFERDMETLTTSNGIEVLYKKNETTDLYSLNYVYNFGKTDDPEMDMAFTYLSYLGTADKSAEQIATEMYGIASSFGFVVVDNKAMVSISGLSENMAKAMNITEGLMYGAVENPMILNALKYDLLKMRADSKLQQQASFQALRRYGTYGPDYIKAITLSNERLVNLDSKALLEKVNSLQGIKHQILYYGPMEKEELLALLESEHKCAETLAEYPVKNNYKALPTNGKRVLVAHYDSPQIYYVQLSNLGGEFDAEQDAVQSLYNLYFGGGMNSIVFQEMREARGLAYSATAKYASPYRQGDTYLYSAFIATQNDKMVEAMKAFSEIIETMPESEAAFQLTKESQIATMRTQRTIKAGVLNAYMAAQDLGIDYDRNERIYNGLQTLTLADIKAFQESKIKGLDYTYMILGDTEDIDMEYLRSIGEVEIVSAEEIFGF